LPGRQAIRIALGENVKQSNWGELNVLRFLKRMGTEQVFVDAFTPRQGNTSGNGRLQQVEQEPAKKPPALPEWDPRRDLELDDAGQEILNKSALHYHSYVQSRINMLLGVAEPHGLQR
jgi:hypothetical protein